MIKKIDSNISFSDSGIDTIITYILNFSNIEKKSIKLKRAVLKLPLSVDTNYSGGFKVMLANEQNPEGVIDYFEKAGPKGSVCIDITNELSKSLKNNDSSLQLVIKNGSQIEYTQSEAKVLIDYTLKKSKKYDNPLYEYDLKKTGNINVDLSIGSLNLKHSDISSNKNSLPIKISHVYTTLAADEEADTIVVNNEEKNIFPYNCGKGWKLNLQQYLIKDTKEGLANDKESSKIFTYIDGMGNHEYLLEKYYYIEGGEKKYLKLNEITIDLDGNLSYGNHDVKKEVISNTGLTLVSELEGFSNIQLINKDAEDLATLNDEIDQLTKSKLTYQIDKTSMEKEKNQLLVMMDEINDLSDELQLLNYSYEKKDIDLKKDLKNSLIAYQKIALKYHNLLPFSNYKESMEEDIDKILASDDWEAVFNNTLEEKLVESESSLLPPSAVPREEREINEEIREKIFDYSNEISYRSLYGYTDVNTNENGGGDSVEYTGTLVDREQIYNKSVELLEKKTQYNKKQLELQNEKLSNDIITITDSIDMINVALEKKKMQRAYLENKLPVHYLNDNNGIVFGFSKTEIKDVYRLSIIADACENIAYINYKNNKIESISDQNGILFDFKYIDDLIESISNHDGKKINFKYTGRYLNEIIYSNKQKSKYIYNENGFLKYAINPSGYGLSFDYSTNQITKIKEITSSKKITKNGTQKYIESESDLTIDNEYYKMKGNIEISYHNKNYTEVNDKKTNKFYSYLFDNMGNLTTCYENKLINGSIIGNTKVVSHNIDNTNNRTFKIESLLNPINYLENIPFNKNEKIIVGDLYFGEEVVLGDEILLENREIYSNESDIYSLTNELSLDNKLEKVLNATNGLNELISTGSEDFILSCWAIADSAYVDRRLTDYSPNNQYEDDLQENELEELINESADEFKKNRRFELRAELKYDNGDVVQQYCSFDWMNSGWQYCAFPVTICKEKTLLEIKVVFDYSNNIGIARLCKISLTEGKWEYSEYNSEKLLSYYESSEENVMCTYEYENKNLITKTINKNGNYEIIKYEYDFNNKLLSEINETTGIILKNEYDERGNNIKSYTYHKTNPSSRLYSVEKKYNERGVQEKEYNEFGEEIKEYIYRDNSNVIELVKDNGIMSIGYNDESIVSISKDSLGKSNSNIIQNDFDLITLLSHNDINYNYEYNGFGKLEKVLINDIEYMEISYEDIPARQLQSDGSYVDIIEGTKIIVDLKNGEKYFVYLNEKNDVKLISFLNKNNILEDIMERQYDSYGNLNMEKHYDGNKVIIYTFQYDKFNNLINGTCSKGVKLENSDDIDIQDIIEYTDTLDKDKIQKHNQKIQLTNVETNQIKTIFREINYYYENQNLSRIQLTNGLYQDIEYDKLERVKKIKNGEIITKEYDYLQKGDHTSSIVTSECFIKNNIIKERIDYKYDKYGNIIQVFEDGKIVLSYEYDQLSRLVRENNKKLNKTIIYSYDNGGNIVKKDEYFYTVDSKDELGDSISCFYGYKSEGFRDQLMTFNDEVFEYDNLGNPIIYRNIPLQWEKGKQLIQYGDIAKYTYDSNGLRMTKNVSEIVTDFYYESGNIIAQNNGDLVLFNYGIDGLEGFTYADKNYHYKKNILGDIVSIMEDNGQEIVKYVYDAYGNHKIFILDNGSFVDISTTLSYTNEGSSNAHIANLNPFRYRSYYYDVETKLYYLMTRYYDPETGRFISMDSIEYLSPENINGLNLYCYCTNNPIMFADPKGNSIFLTIGLLVGAFVVGAGISVVNQGVNYGWSNINYWEVVIDGLLSAGVAALSFTGIPAWGIALISAGTGLGQYAMDAAFHNEKMTLLGGMTSVILGWIFGYVGGAGARNLFSISDDMVGLTDDGVRAIKAITNAANKYVAGNISKKGMQATFNLYSGVASRAIQNAIPTTIRSLMIKGTMFGSYYSILNSAFSNLFGKIFKKLGVE